MRTLVVVGIAGFIGAFARYGIEGFVSEKTSGSFPWGTFVVNVDGSFVIGLLFALLVEGGVSVTPWLRTGAMVGLVGAYTTFSTFTLETVPAEDGSYVLAGANAFGSLVLGLVATYVGIVTGRAI